MTEETIYCPFCTRPCKGLGGFWSHANQNHRAAVDLIKNVEAPQTRREWDDERDILLARIDELERQAFGLGWEPPEELKLTPHEVAILQILVTHDRVVSHGAIFEATRHAPHSRGEDVEEKIVHIRISLLRRKLRAFNLTISTSWGRGYRLEAASRARLLNWNKPAEDIAA